MLPETFHFLRPAWLLAAPAIAPFLWMALRGRGAASAWRRVCDPELLAHLALQGDGRGRRWPVALFSAGWLTACLALAGPSWERLPQPSYKMPAASVLVVNLSPSMDATDVAPSRLGRARFEVMDALAGLPGEQLSLVIFSEEPYTVTPLSDDPGVIASQVPVLETSLMPGHGTRVDRAIDHASELLTRGGSRAGRILLVTDGAGDEPGEAIEAAARAAARGQRVSVLGVGTEEGAPVPTRHGFARDALGNPLVVKLQRESLEAIAAAGHGRFAVATADDSDLHAVMPPAEPVPGYSGEIVASGVRTDVWRDMGAWLLVIPLLLAPLAFRRGSASSLPALLLLLGTSLALPRDARAAGLDDWLLRPDQRGARALAEGRPADAAKLFEDEAWRAAALYRAQDYAGAAESLRDQKGPEARYNLGNALAKAGQLEQALAAYDEALAAQPDHADARFNRDLVAKLLEDQKKQPQDQQQKQDQNSQNQDQNQQQQDQKQQAAQQGQQQDPQQQDPDQQQGSRQQQEEKRQDSQQSQNAQAQPQQPDAKDSQDQRAESQEPRHEPQQSADAADEDDQQTPTNEQPAPQGAERTGPQNERELALEQWLNRIPDDPGGLLREKLRRQYAERRYGGR